MLKHWHLLIDICLACILHLTLTSFAHGAYEYDFPQPTGVLLTDVCVLSGSLVYAVGNGGAILRYDGVSWVEDASPTHKNLHSIWAAAVNDIYACGENGTIIHFDGNSWSLVDNPATGLLRSVWGVSATNVYVGGDDCLAHFDGVSWSLVAGQSGIYVIGGLNAGHVFFGKSGGVIVEYDGSSATSTTLPCEGYVADIWSDASNALALTSDGIIFRMTLTIPWTLKKDLNVPTDCLWAVSVDEIYTGGARTIHKIVGDTVDSTDLPSPFILAALHGNTRFDLHAVGGGGQIFRYNGASWTRMSETNPDKVQDLAVAADGTVYVVCDNGGIYRKNASGWGEMSSPVGTALNAVSCPGGGNPAAVGDGGVAIRLSGGTWQTEYTGQTSNLNDIWGPDASTRIAVGDGGLIMSYSNGQWSMLLGSPTTRDLFAVFGFSATNYFIAGHQIILHYNNGSWSTHTSLDTYHSLWGTAGNDMYVAGVNEVLHYDGVSWSSIYSIPLNLAPHVTGASSSDVFFSSNMDLYHYNGDTIAHQYQADSIIKTIACFQTNSVYLGMDNGILHENRIEKNFETPTSENLNGVAVTRMGKAWAVGDNGMILRGNRNGWRTTPSSVTRHLKSVDAKGAMALAVGDYGTVLRTKDQGWETMPLGWTIDLEDVWMASPTFAFAVGKLGAIFLYDGTSWTKLSHPLNATGTWFMAVSGLNKNYAFAVALNVLYRWNGATWAKVDGITGDFDGVYVAAENDVFIIGPDGLLLRWDGQNAVQQELPATDQTSPVFNHIWGTGPDNVHVVGAQGLHLRFNGARWDQIPAPTGRDLASIHGLDSNNVLITAENGEILGHCAFPVALPWLGGLLGW